MRRRLLSLMAVSSCVILFSPQTQAQNQDLRIGSATGRSLGQSGNLWALLQQAHYPLRMGILPMLSLDTEPNEASLQTDLNQALKTELPELRQIDTKVTGIFSNQNILTLADQSQLDLILQPKLKSVAGRHWLMLSIYSGPSGQVIFNTSTALSEINPRQISSIILKTLQEIPLSTPVHDLSPPDPLTGELHLRTRPEGMQVYLNQHAVGLTPLFIRGITAGEHLVQIQENIPYQVSRIQILSTPPGLQISVNGKRLGQAPLDLPPELLGPGTYSLRFDGPENFTAEIRVLTQPDQVPVQLNQLPVQRSPVSFQALKETEHTLTLLPYPAVRVRKPFVIRPQEATALEINAYKSARLSVDSSIGDAQIHLNDEWVGDTPYTSNLAQGEHQLKISKTRYRTQEHRIQLQPGETHTLFYKLIPRSTDTSIFLTPTGELSSQLNLGIKYLGLGSLEPNSWAHLYGIEADYGWPSLYRFTDTFELGLSISAFTFSLNSQTIWRRFQGLGTKIQFLRESERIPISAAIGTYLSLDPEHSAWVGYFSLSRNFGDFAIHLGLQTHGFNLNFGYTGWDHLRLSGIVYSDSFLRLLAQGDESSTTFYGLQLGYSF